MGQKNEGQEGFSHALGVVLVFIVAAVIIAVYLKIKAHNRTAQKTQPVAINKTVEPTTTMTPVPEVMWHRGEGGVWEPSSTPPACPEQPMLATPVDMSLVTSILYPGQVRGTAFKPHGGFRFDKQPNNTITVTVPMDAKLMRASKGNFPENGEVQYGFEFIAPCGIWYAFGHIHTLSPQFQAYMKNIPEVDEIGQQQLYDVEGQPNVKKGDVIATEVGIVHTKNIFVEWQVNDLRQKNGQTIRPEWSKYQDEFDPYGVCWLDWLPPADATKAHTLPGGDGVNGKKSDYCK